MSLVSRHLEEAGIPTIVVGSALDIVTTVAAPRFLFVDTPLGNPIGPPDDRDAQRATVLQALSIVMEAAAPDDAKTLMVRSPLEWPTQEWRERYMWVGDDNREALAEAGKARRAAQASTKNQS